MKRAINTAPGVVRQSRVKRQKLQLQEMPSKDLIFAKLKPADSTMLMLQLANSKNFEWQRFQKEKKPLTLTDLGGGEGLMLNYFMGLAARINLNINEPEKDLRESYEEKAFNDPRVTIKSESDKPMQNKAFVIPKSDVLLASHSLYYSRTDWEKPVKDVGFKNHLLTKFFSALKDKGVVCVVLQSEALSGIKGHNGKDLANLETFEDEAYPLISKYRDEKVIGNKQRSSFTNAESFETALAGYNLHLKDLGNQLNILKSNPVVTCIGIDDINFDKVEKGKYKQSTMVMKYFDFYARGKYSDFNLQEQKEFLDFIKNNCHATDGKYYITHVNKVFVVSLQRPFADEEQYNYPECKM